MDTTVGARNFRIMAAMVGQALEMELGAYITESAATLDDVPSGIREEVERQSGPATSMGEMLQNTYVGQLIDTALHLSKHRSDHEHLRQLRDLVNSLRFFEIRNAWSHPNRPFPECYWHRMAAIATDPTISRLGLEKVMTAFRSAEAGKLDPPSEEWMTQHSWAIPNNLPDTFDHEITGLIGREKELKVLKEQLRNQRYQMLALVGPGGTGKTALCLEVLRDACNAPISAEWMDQCIYISAKTEWLTTFGIIEVSDNAVESIEAVKLAIAKSLHTMEGDGDGTGAFEEVISSLKDRRILLCLDNLETLLRDDAERFQAFYGSLPPAWRVLVTSRVGVNSATITSVGAMSIPSAVRLARDYLAKRGGGRLGEEELKGIAEATDSNPLGIRLVIDSYVAGVSLEESLSHSKDQVLNFSYRNLMQALPSVSLEILECLFAVGTPKSRSEVGTLLDKSVDEIASGIQSLVRTSLISRHAEDLVERISISSSVRELLLRNPQNPRVRELVQRKLRENEETVRQLDRAGHEDPLAVDFIPVDAPKHIRATAYNAFRVTQAGSNADAVLRVREGIERMISAGESHGVLFRALSRAYEALKDRSSAIASLELGVARGEFDAASNLRLGEYRYEERKLDEAAAATSVLIDQAFHVHKNVTSQNAIRLLRCHWLSQIWVGNCQRAVREMHDWRKRGELRPTCGCLYMAAIRELLKDETNRTQQHELASEMLTVCDELLASDGYTTFLVHECLSSLREIHRVHSRSTFAGDVAHQMCRILTDHLKGLCMVENDKSIDDDESIKWIKTWSVADTGTRENPLCAEIWQEVIEAKEDEALGAYGYRVAEVYHRPKLVSGKFSSFLFVRDREGNEYHLAQNNSDLTPARFEKVKEGDQFQIKPGVASDKLRATPVADAIFME